MLLVNKDLPLGEDFVPNYLAIPYVLLSEKGHTYKYYVTLEVKEALEDMFYDALDERIVLSFVSGYRSYNRQQSIYEKSIEKNGLEHTEKYIAKPGHSEHQTGLAVDISSPTIYSRLVENFNETKEGKWVSNNCHKYGFILRYPKGKEDITGYAYEPWHLRYVGKEIATRIKNNGLTLEEWMEKKK